MIPTRWELLSRLLDSEHAMTPFTDRPRTVNIRAGLDIGYPLVQHEGDRAILALPLEVRVQTSLQFDRCLLKLPGMEALAPSELEDPGRNRRMSLACLYQGSRNSACNDAVFQPLRAGGRIAGYLEFESCPGRLLRVRLGERLEATLWFEDTVGNIYGAAAIVFDRSSPSDFEDWHAQYRSSYGIL